MALERLEILRFSQDGQVLRRLVCLAGRVSVFRARSQSNIELYRDALSGRPTSSRFSLLLDGATFKPEEHNFIGFGESFSADQRRSVANYLLDAGVSKSELEPTLARYGLGGLSAAECVQLSPQQQMMLRLLGASCCPERLLVCNNPFQHIPETWHGAFAERLTDFAWRRRAIVVVPELSVRPDYWIENEHIARLSLEPPRKATIGFGGSGSLSADIVANIRQQVQQFDLAAGDAPEPVRAGSRSSVQGHFSAAQNFIISALSRRGRSQYMLAGLIITVFLTSAALMKVLSGAGPEAAPPLSGGSRDAPQHAAAQSADEHSVIDGYPESVRRAVLLAFNKPEDVIRARAAAAERRSAALQQKQPAAVAPHPVSAARRAPEERQEAEPDEEETRRMERRKAFLEAIRRSRDEELTDEEREERAERRQRLLEALRRHREFRDMN